MMKSLASIQQTPVEENMSNLTTASGEASVSSSNRNDNGGMYPPLYNFPPANQPQPQPIKKKRNQPGHPDPDAEVIALSPRTLLATNRFVCEICNKGFQRDQNLQLHRRGHNLPWKLKQRTSKEIRKKVYVCPESSCVHHDPSRALGDLTGVKKHFCRKHGEKKWKCEKCSKRYAVQSDWKAHSKICGTKEYRCDCGTIFSRRDSFITHRAFCDALAEENARNNTIPFQAGAGASSTISHHVNLQQIQSQFNNTNELPFPIKKEQQNFSLRQEIQPWLSCTSFLGPQPIDLTSSTTPSSLFQDFQHNQDHQNQNPNPNPSNSLGPTALPHYHHHQPHSPHLSATALLQKAAQMGAKGISNQCASPAGAFIRPHQTHMSAAPGDPGQNITAGFGLNLSSRDEFINGLTSFGNKAAAVTGGGSTEPGGDTSNNSNNIINNNNNPLSSSSSSFLHEMMMNHPHPLSSSTGFDGSTFVEDMNAFGGILNHPATAKKVQETLGNFSSSNEGGGNDGLTRDFLGLRPLSRSEILSLTGLGNCMNSGGGGARTQNDGNQTQKSWQG